MGKRNWVRKNYGPAASQMTKKLMYDLAYKTAINADSINKESAAYLNISEELFMPAVQRLGTLIALDPEEDKAKIRFEKNQLDRQSQAMVDKIDDILAAEELD